MSDLPDGFRQEANKQLRALGNGLVDLESDPDPATVDEMFRAAHGLKSNCAMVDLDGARDLAHAVEDALEAVRAGELELTETVVDDALAAVDLTERAIGAAATGEGPPDPSETVERLRNTVAAKRGEATASGGSVGDEAVPHDEPDTADASTAEPDPDTNGNDVDLSVEEALEAVSEFDDLDALADDLDDADLDDLDDGWGTFDTADSEGDRPIDHAVDRISDGAAGVGPADGLDKEDTPVNQGTAAFEEVKSEVDSAPATGDLGELEGDIEAETFGEFDDVDDLSIDDLLSANPANEVSSEAEDVGAGEVAPNAAGADAEPADATDAFAKIAEEVEDDDDLEALQTDIEAETFGEFDDEDEFTIPELVESGPAALDEEATLETNPDPVAGDADEERTVEANAKDAGNEDAPASNSPTDHAQNEAVDDPFITATPVEANPEAAPIADDSVPGSAEATAPEPGDGVVVGDEIEATADEDDPVVDDEPDALVADERLSADPEVEQLLDDVEFGEAADATDAGDAADPADVGAAANRPVADDAGPAGDEPAAGLDDALAELEDLAADEGLDTDGPEAESPAFARDADVEAFTEQFGDIFGGDDETGEDIQPPATILEESALPIEPVTGEETAGADDADAVGAVTVDVDVADDLLRSVEELATAHLRLERALREEDGPAAEEVLTGLRSTTAALRDTVTAVRLTPLSSVTDDLPRVVRSAARETDTDVSLSVEGTDVTLDRGIIDRLHDPLVHLVRNAVDHGIEPPSERKAAGKPREGTVRVSAERRRDRGMIEVSDDGRGLDIDRIRRTAIEGDLFTEQEAAELPVSEVYDLIFHPGFSTADEVTAVSGRGVGLDSVRQAVTELNGTVEVDSDPGEGTTIRLNLPVSAAVVEVLFVRSGDEQYAIPLSAVKRVGEPGTIEMVDDREHVTIETVGGHVGADPAAGPGPDTAVDDDGEVPDGASDDEPERYPLIRLAEAFDTCGGDGDGIVVHLEQGNQEFALHCDETGETREVVVDPYTGLLSGLPGLGGTTTLGNGTLVNVIDPHTL